MDKKENEENWYPDRDESKIVDKFKTKYLRLVWRVYRRESI